MSLDTIINNFITSVLSETNVDTKKQRLEEFINKRYNSIARSSNPAVLIAEINKIVSDIRDDPENSKENIIEYAKGNINKSGNIINTILSNKDDRMKKYILIKLRTLIEKSNVCLLNHQPILNIINFSFELK